jgi:hypothetical protein
MITVNYTGPLGDRHFDFDDPAEAADCVKQIGAYDTLTLGQVTADSDDEYGQFVLARAANRR